MRRSAPEFSRTASRSRGEIPAAAINVSTLACGSTLRVDKGSEQADSPQTLLRKFAAAVLLDRRKTRGSQHRSLSHSVVIDPRSWPRRAKFQQYHRPPINLSQRSRRAQQVSELTLPVHFSRNSGKESPTPRRMHDCSRG